MNFAHTLQALQRKSIVPKDDLISKCTRIHFVGTKPDKKVRRRAVIIITPPLNRIPDEHWQVQF